MLNPTFHLLLCVFLTQIMTTSLPTDSSPRKESGPSLLSQGHYHRFSSFARDFPEIPVLQFESEGDKLEPDKPKLRCKPGSWFSIHLD